MELVKINAQDFGIEPQKASELMGNLPQIQSERDILAAQYDDVVKMDIEDEKTSKIARELRLKIRDNRTKGIVAWHKTNKEVFLRGGQFVDAVKNREVEINERMESNLEQIEKHFENLEKQRIEKLQTERIELIKPFVEDVSNLNLGTMEQDVFDAFLSVKQKQYNDRIEAEAKAKIEAERIEKERLEAIEKQRLENEKLKAEADKREKEIEAERKANEQKLADERAKAKAEAEKIEAENKAKLKAEQEAKAKIAAELQAKKDAETKAENERLQAELKAKKEAEKLAKAPIKKQLSIWVDGFSIAKIDIENDKKELIIAKFEAFKKWAKSEIESI